MRLNREAQVDFGGLAGLAEGIYSGHWGNRRDLDPGAAPVGYAAGSEGAIHPDPED
ncbi:MAG: hypothetical protein WAM44_02645 [Chthoniobacterales bacterium]